MAMEDFRVDVVIGKGPGATAIPLEIPPFTLVGATTRAGLLPGPLRDRFGFTAHLEFYEPAELELIVRRSAGLLGRRAHRRGRGRDRLPLPRHAPHRQPAAAAGPRLRPGARRRGGDPRRGAPGARPVRGRPVRPRPARPRGARRAVPPLRRRAGGRLARSRSRVGEERETVEEVAEPFLVRSRAARAHAARPGRDAGRLGAPRPAPCRAARRSAGPVPRSSSDPTSERGRFTRRVAQTATGAARPSPLHSAVGRPAMSCPHHRLRCSFVEELWRDFSRSS